ncbi:MAG: hypothetical protein O2782_02950 [bacterium]|nr:hypothetical protein [bacterium]
MVRGLLMLAVLVAALGCGKEEEAAELKTYVLAIKQLHPLCQRVEATIVRFDDPTQDITLADIQEARDLLTEYSRAVAAVTAPTEKQAKNTHGLYARSFEEAERLATDETGDMRRQAHSVAIGLRNLRRTVEDRVYPSLSVLLARHKLQGETYELSWPKTN